MSWSFGTTVPSLIIGALVWALSGWICWQNWQRSGRRKAVARLEALRFLLVCLLSFTLLRPEVVQKTERRDKPEVAPIARALAEMGYKILATQGTADALRTAGIDVEAVPKLREGRPNVIDHMKNGRIALVINTPSGKGARTDEGRIRASAVSHGVSCITTIAGARAAVAAMERLRAGKLEVYALQDLLSIKSGPTLA